MVDKVESRVPFALSERCQTCLGGVQRPPRDPPSILAFLRTRLEGCQGCIRFNDLFILPILNILEGVYDQQPQEGGWSDEVRHLRAQMGLSQEQFAQRLGVRREQVSRYEQGRQTPGMEVQKKLEALRADLED